MLSSLNFSSAIHLPRLLAVVVTVHNSPLNELQLIVCGGEEEKLNHYNFSFTHSQVGVLKEQQQQLITKGIKVVPFYKLYYRQHARPARRGSHNGLTI